MAAQNTNIYCVHIVPYLQRRNCQLKYLCVISDHSPSPIWIKVPVLDSNFVAGVDWNCFLFLLTSRCFWLAAPLPWVVCFAVLMHQRIKKLETPGTEQMNKRQRNSSTNSKTKESACSEGCSWSLDGWMNNSFLYLGIGLPAPVWLIMETWEV